MRKLIILILPILVIFGCTAQNKVYRQKAQDTFEVPPLPKWIYSTPENYVIGISRKSMNLDNMKDSAKQMASVMESRNNASYTIEKYATTTSENILKSNITEFKLNVSSSPQHTEQIYNSLTLVDSIEALGYFFGLFSRTSIEVQNLDKRAYIQRLPEFYDIDKLMISDDAITCFRTESSASLVHAWEKAAEEARFEIAKYYEKQVQSAIINTDEITEKRIALETAEKMSRMKLKASCITTELKDNLRLFKVYHEMEIVR